MEGVNSISGAKINTVKTRFSSRDPLGIESVAATISGEVCPVVNTVTPRAFYWAFLCWIYHDFYKNSGIKEWNSNTFDQDFLKRQDYYFVLANLLVKNPDQMNLVGKQKTAADIDENPEGPYPFNRNYFVSRYGGMQYYNAGCLTMKLIVEEDEESGKTYALPRMTQYGEEMALAFENVIKDTEYYKHYRLKNTLVPRSVLLEYGRTVQLNMDHFDECKRLLRHHLFGRNKKLGLCAEYARQVYGIVHTHDLSGKTARHILYDYYSPRGDRYVPEEALLDVIQGWEIIVGRQYFTAGIEMIWKYMLALLSVPCSLENWTENVLKHIDTGLLEQPVASLLPKCDYTFEEREEMVTKARAGNIRAASAVDGLKLALSVYNRFVDRKDFGMAASFLDAGRGRVPGTGAVSVNEWIELVDRYRKASVRDFLTYIMRECIVEQHKRTCFEKITRTSQSIDGFYFECFDDMYVGNEHQFQVGFQGLRFIQLMQVMDDLNMFDEV